jgi:hypothetical protein
MNLRSILELDARLSDRLRVAEQPGLLRTLAVFFAHSGDSWFWGLGLLLLWWLGDSFWKQWVLIMFAGIVALIVVVMSIKFTVRRRRPEGEWGGIYRNTDPHSFPSPFSPPDSGPPGWRFRSASGRRWFAWHVSQWVCITFRMSSSGQFWELSLGWLSHSLRPRSLPGYQVSPFNCSSGCVSSPSR